MNADLSVDPELIGVAESQAARFSQTCRVFAPVYRQLTVGATGSASGQSADARAVAYDSVLSAWRDYLAHDNKGRASIIPLPLVSGRTRSIPLSPSPPVPLIRLSKTVSA